eukprot:c34911_g1_i1 orf=383-1027(+)
MTRVMNRIRSRILGAELKSDIIVKRRLRKTVNPRGGKKEDRSGVGGLKSQATEVQEKGRCLSKKINEEWRREWSLAASQMRSLRSQPHNGPPHAKHEGIHVNHRVVRCSKTEKATAKKRYELELLSGRKHLWKCNIVNVNGSSYGIGYVSVKSEGMNTSRRDGMTLSVVAMEKIIGVLFYGFVNGKELHNSSPIVLMVDINNNFPSTNVEVYSL